MADMDFTEVQAQPPVVAEAQQVAAEHGAMIGSVETMAALSAAYYRSLIAGGVPDVFAFQLTAIWQQQSFARGAQ